MYFNSVFFENASGNCSLVIERSAHPMAKKHIDLINASFLLYNTNNGFLILQKEGLCVCEIGLSWLYILIT